MSDNPYAKILLDAGGTTVRFHPASETIAFEDADNIVVFTRVEFEAVVCVWQEFFEGTGAEK